MQVLGRIAAALLGGYAFSAGIAVLAAVGLGRVMPPSEAVVLMSMLGFVLYLAVLLWVFAEPRLGRLWAVLLGGAALSHGLAHWLSPVLVGG